MMSHPAFADRNIPAEHRLSGFILKALNVSDLDRDYAAVMDTAADIRAAAPHLTWPEGLTKEENFIDLAWHQKEFAARRSFAWVIENASAVYLGCAYVYPSIAGEQAADVLWWWRTGAKADRAAFQAAFHNWLEGPEWPNLDYRLKMLV